MNYLKLSWWNDHDLGDILYQDGYRNVMYLDVEVEKPEYNTTIESDLNGDNVEIARLRKEEKVYRFELWGQEDLTDAFAFMQIHDNIEVTLQTGEVLQVAKHGLRADISWEEIGCLAKISVSFTENYILAGNCDENKSVECYCADPGAFDGYLSIADKGTTSGIAGDVILFYSVLGLAGKLYTGSLWRLTTTGAYDWVVMSVEQYACYVSSIDATVWFYDGQFWHLFPGYIIALTAPTGTEISVSAWILPGTFGNVYYSKNGGGSVLVGAYTKDELDTGITFTHAGAGTYDIWITVYNHSCAYLNTKSGQIIIAP